MNELFLRYPALHVCRAEIADAFALLRDAYLAGGKLLLCGNGGSAADCEHIVGELMKSFLLPRPVEGETADALRACGEEALLSRLQGSLPAISLPHQSAILSAFANDVSAEHVYAQLVLGYGKREDVLWCISTSGNSANVVAAARVARAKGMRTLALTGEGESALSSLCDVTVRVPAKKTHEVQELHLPVYHALCAALERDFYGKG